MLQIKAGNMDKIKGNAHCKSFIKHSIRIGTDFLPIMIFGFADVES